MGVFLPAAISSSVEDAVSIQPGATAFTVMPLRATSNARLRVKPTIAALAALVPEDFIRERLSLFAAGEVGRLRDDLDTCGDQFLSSVFNSARCGGDRHTRAFFSQQPRSRESDPGGAAGSRHQRNSFGQGHRCAAPLLA